MSLSATYIIASNVTAEKRLLSALSPTSMLEHNAILNVSFTMHGTFTAFDRRRAKVDFPAARYPVTMIMHAFIGANPQI